MHRMRFGAGERRSQRGEVETAGEWEERRSPEEELEGWAWFLR